MNRLFLALISLLSGWCVTVSKAEDESQPQPVSLEQAIGILENRSQDMGTRIVEFVEKRVFPFRSKAATVRGIVRMSDSLGVSIEYPEKDAVLIIDDAGLIMRRLKDNGKVRERHVSLEDGELAGLMAAVMSFDKERLLEAFDLSVDGDKSSWVLTLKPKGETSEKVVKASIHSDAKLVNEVQIELKGSRQILIEILEERPVDRFDEETIQQYFRGDEEG